MFIKYLNQQTNIMDGESLIYFKNVNMHKCQTESISQRCISPHWDESDDISTYRYIEYLDFPTCTCSCQFLNLISIHV